MRVSKRQREFACAQYPEIYPGVHGDVVVRKQGQLTITFINTLWAKEEGSGQVGKYLDSLEGRVIVPSVVSMRLKKMLERRGYKPYDVSGMRKDEKATT